MRGAVRTGLALATVAAAVIGLGACSGTAIQGTPQAMQDIDTDKAGGLEVSDDGPTGPREGVEDAKLDVEGTTGNEMDRLATNAIADLYDFWDEELPAGFDTKFRDPAAGVVRLERCRRDDLRREHRWPGQRVLLRGQRRGRHRVGPRRAAAYAE